MTSILSIPVVSAIPRKRGPEGPAWELRSSNTTVRLTCPPSVGERAHAEIAKRSAGQGEALSVLVELGDEEDGLRPVLRWQVEDDQEPRWVAATGVEVRFKADAIAALEGRP